MEYRKILEYFSLVNAMVNNQSSDAERQLVLVSPEHDPNCSKTSACW